MLVQIAVTCDDRLGSNFFSCDEKSTNSAEVLCIEHLKQLEKKQKIIGPELN